MVRHRIVISGGGTGGHIYPALAVAEQLQGNDEVEDLIYIGVEGHPEEKLATKKGLKFTGVKVSGLPRKLSIDMLYWPFEFVGAVCAARKVLQDFKPTVVLGTGGYASAPPLVAALSLGIPYAIHEPDAHPGLVNRLLARWASLVSVGMEAAAKRLLPGRGKIVVNGNPVRKSLVNPLSREAACAILGLNQDLKTVLVTGGSQGAQALNEALVLALPALLSVDPPIQIIHQTGEKNILDIKGRLSQSILENPRYHLRAYFDDLSLAYLACDLAVCRAGAMTIAELAVSGTPALFVPYPYAASDHQMHNAQYMVAKEAAVMLIQAKVNPQSLHDQILGLLSNVQRLESMRKNMLALGKPHASADLASQIMELSTSCQARTASRS